MTITSGGFMESKKVKKSYRDGTLELTKPKYQFDDFGRVKGDFIARQQVDLVSANTKLLKRNIVRGFNPKWYVVGHFNDGGDIKRLQKRRLDPHHIEDDLLAVKLKLFQILYGRGWDKMKYRARSQWTIEFGNSEIKPHYNLLIEELPKGWDQYQQITKLFNELLPSKVRCLWTQSTKIERIYNDPLKALNQYIHKESNFFNGQLPVRVNDYIQPNRRIY